MSERVVRGRSIDIVRVAESRLTEWRTCFSRQCYRIAASSPIACLPCFAPHTKSVFAQIAELAVVEFGQCAPALVRSGPPAPALAQGLGARDADIAELLVIELGEDRPGPPVLPPALDRGMGRQHRVDGPENDVIVPQQAGRRLARGL